MIDFREQQISDFLVESQERLYRMAYGYLQNREDALDAVQATACLALEHAHRLKRDEAVKAWCCRILVNVCMDKLRQRKRIVFLPPEEIDAGSYEDPLPDDDLSARVAALPPEIQTVIRLRFYEELSLQEIAEITGWNLSTVKTRLYSGLKKLRLSLEGV